MDLRATLFAAGWRYDAARDVFRKGEQWVTYQQAEAALAMAEIGIDAAKPVNDDVPQSETAIRLVPTDDAL